MVSTPQWNFRHELTYTEFTWSNYKINKSVFQKNETLVITLHVKNTGERDGIDLVQVFVSDLVASVTRPTYELKGFSRVAAKKGEVVSVEIQIPINLLAIVNKDAKWELETGGFEVFVGSQFSKWLFQASFDVTE
eukprot:TRINITY_DN5561_c0_g2_i4.p3 TRINITY_DN5561_c0_g2~~TRINITY_DN5561_c0_g2_i4.p3  ORF type:complete len:135 (+),score=36.48 TRINITY_DN5561_c0_g2_i4:1838-2242(+)